NNRKKGYYFLREVFNTSLGEQYAPLTLLKSSISSLAIKQWHRPSKEGEQFHNLLKTPSQGPI
ncbi:MAG: hypothetical protein AAFQ63_21160, partial [Cyanobacteria bacterium J06621_11]